MMDKTLKLVGRTANEIYVLRYPSTLLDFCDYELPYFAKKAVEVCSEAQKTGEVDFDSFTELRRDIQNAHCYIEHHIRTIYEKIAIDCYIDYLCRRDSVGTGTLWNRFIACRNPFEKLVFQRLCELRYNRAINEWLNIVRVQEYAKCKMDFVFPNGIKSSQDAAARRNYFDLIFSVTASEMGCRLEELGETRVFSIARIPNAPFMLPSVSKDIMRNVLADFDYSDDYSDVENYGANSDEIAMDAFSRMKNGLSAELTSYNILRTKLENYDKIYMPCSLKAVIDLEIDAIIESGGYLAFCKKCGKRYYRGKDYDEDYCSYLHHNGKTCLEEYLEENPPKRMTAELEQKSREVTDTVYSRVGTSMNTNEYENWYSYMNAMKEKVQSGEISPEEFDSFLEYSRGFDISRSKPIVEVPKQQTGKERVIKPFVPERIQRSAIKQPKPDEEQEETEISEKPSQQSNNDGFFVSPSVARRSSERRISHVIRAGEPRGEDNYTRPNPADFRPFSPNEEQNQHEKNNTEPNHYGQKQSEPRNAFAHEERYSGEEFQPNETDNSAENSIENRILAELEAIRGKAEQKPSGGFHSFFEENYAPKQELDSINSSVREPISDDISEKSHGSIFDDFIENIEQKPAENNSDNTPDNSGKIPEKPTEQPAPRARVIKKNAAAISAYGKMSGAPIISAPPEMDFVSRAGVDESGISDETDRAGKSAQRNAFAADVMTEPDSEPFKDIGSIFDVLENSSAEGSSETERRKRVSDNIEKTENTERDEHSRQTERRRPTRRARETDANNVASEREYPSEITKDNAPAGFWTEDRGLFREDSQSELDMLKDKKQHVKSNKTKRLYDVIMREPDDNPNFRKK